MEPVVVNSNSQFYKTLQLYRNYIGYSNPYTYRQWMRLSDDHKVAALYCQFYNEITLAWYKVHTPWAIEEEGVTLINQYLTKNVEKIKKDRKRFKPQYIYKVAYNCLYCHCIDPTKHKERYEKETSSVFSTSLDSDSDSCDWFDIIGDNTSIQEIIDSESCIKFFDYFKSNVCLDIFMQYKLDEINDIQAVRILKKSGVISGNVKNADYRKSILEMLDSIASEYFKLLLTSTISEKSLLNFNSNKITTPA